MGCVLTSVALLQAEDGGLLRTDGVEKASGFSFEHKCATPTNTEQSEKPDGATD